ncbi:YcxB family protein [Chryseobacterium sp. Leaf313]|uniref:YcxB family protein n=1 Tax=Chryseobacterium sp. Leaf313 TaxID=2876563 RepID=UPI0012FEE292|nr:YcxB family protein [Chryseobacterium sp. Leaf313]
MPRIIIFSLVLLLFFVLNFYNSENGSNEIYKYVLIWFPAIVIFIFIRSYLSLKNAFYSNLKIQEEIVYTFTDEKIQTRGETFESDFAWNTVYKIKENRDWFLIYQSKTVMNMIPKKYFSRNEVSELRKLIKNSGVKAKLLNN